MLAGVDTHVSAEAAIPRGIQIGICCRSIHDETTSCWGYKTITPRRLATKRQCYFPPFANLVKAPLIWLMLRSILS